MDAKLAIVINASQAQFIAGIARLTCGAAVQCGDREAAEQMLDLVHQCCTCGDEAKHAQDKQELNDELAKVARRRSSTLN